MTSDKNWYTQPDIVEGCEVICNFFHKGSNAMVEVRKAEECYLVTMGSLFGSQTVRVSDAEAALRLIGLFTEKASDSSPLDLPEGAELIEG